MASAKGGSSTISRISRHAYRAAGLRPSDIDLAEVHDSIAFNELLAYEELGFCGEGQAGHLVAEGRTALSGDIPVNTSGGLESRGHPIAATGLAQIIELVTQLRGDAGARQVPGARHGLAENAGGYAGGDTAAVAVSILSVDQD
jgi:acetyl-CoA acetyltransferase